MCGRFTQTSDIQKLSKRFKIPIERISSLKPRYNIAPSQPAAVLLREPGQDPEIRPLRWGLVPAWAKDPDIGNKLINARKETLAEKPSFRDSLKNRRCLIPTDGFYEWARQGTRKTPYFICSKSREPLVFAGLWSQWQGPDGSGLQTFTVITGKPNDLVCPIHHRMPAILNEEKQNAWLDSSGSDTSFLLSLLEIYPADGMEAYAVPDCVNDPMNDSPDCMERLPELYL